MVRIFSFNSFNSSKGGLSISGSERVGIDLIKNSIQEGVEVILVGPHDFQRVLENLGENELAKLCIISQKINLYSSFFLLNLLYNYIYRSISTIFLIQKLQKKYKDILFYSVSDFFPDILPPFIVKCKKWYVMSYHLYSKSLSFRSYIGRLAQYLSFTMSQSADKVIVINIECENFLKKNFRMSYIQRIFLGRDLEKFFEARNKVKDLKKIVYVGRFNEIKGFLLLPEIFNELNKRNLDFSACVIGSGEDYIFQEFKKKLAKYNLELKVYLKGNLSNEDLLSEMASSFILLQPSREEGFSYVVLEGLASNLHIVAFDLPIYSQVYSDFGLNLVEINNVQDFASKIVSLFEDKKPAFYPIEKFEIFNPKSNFKSIFN